MSTKAGRPEVYVREFPSGASKVQISTHGGIAPIWRQDGKEIFYVEQRKLMAVGAPARPAFSSRYSGPIISERRFAGLRCFVRWQTIHRHGKAARWSTAHHPCRPKLVRRIPPSPESGTLKATQY